MRDELLALSRCRPGRYEPTSRRPSFPHAVRTLPDRSLAEALAEGISTGHPDMPEFVASPDQIGAIIAYIESLQSK